MPLHIATSGGSAGATMAKPKDKKAIHGDDNANILVGTNAKDTILGFGGNDDLEGLDGDDYLDGGLGFDRAIYTQALEGISVSLAAGTVFGGNSTGTDMLVAIEAIRGTSFADFYDATGFTATSPNGGGDQGSFNEFEGMGGDDAIIGNGNTRLSYLHATGSVTADLFAGTSTGDASVGSDSFSGVNNLRGSNFADTLLGSNNDPSTVEGFEGRGGNDFIDGRDGNDRALYHNDPAGTSGIAVDLAAGLVSGDDSVGTDTLRSIEFVRGTNFGDDYVASGFGSTSLNAGSNGTFNEFEGVGGDDTITGNGNTRISYQNATGAVAVNLAAGTAAGDASVGTDTILGGVRHVRGSGFSDVLIGSNNGAEAEVFEGWGGDDSIDGNGGFDRVRYDNNETGAFGLLIDLGAGTIMGRDGNATAVVGTDTLRSIEAVRGSNVADSYDASTFTAGSTNGGGSGDQGNFNEFEGMGGDDVVVGNGNTRLSYISAKGAVTVNLALGAATGDASVGTDSFSNVNAVRGSDFDDSLVGSNNGDNSLENFEGWRGNDTINGAGGIDRVRYAANDSITTGVPLALGIHVHLGLGIVTGRDAIAQALYGTDTLHSIEFVQGTNADDVFDATGFNGGSAGAGSTFNDFEGLGGNDTVTGNGDTRISFQSATAAVTVDLGAGTVVGDVSVGSDTITGGVNRVRGSQFDDQITGSTGAEILEGQGGNDLLWGGDGADTLRGDAGSDTLTGGRGGDVLTGGAGDDTFVYADGDGADLIFGFVAGAGTEDRIDLTGVAGVHRFSDLVITQDGADAVIHFSPGAITLKNLNSADLEADDFIFGQSIERVSVASNGTQADGPSYTGFGPYITFSGDGRYLAFYSDASNLVAGDTNGLGDFFIFDRSTGALERVPANNIYGGGGPILSSISADGRYLAFGSYADDLVDGDSNGKGDIFVYDRLNDTTQRIQANLTPGADAASPVISADGNFVAFSSFADDIVPGDNNGVADLFVFDRTTETTERVLAGGPEEPNHNSQVTSISGDGRFVAFYSAASNLISGDFNGVEDVFVFDRFLNEIDRISVASDGTQANASSAQPSISADGRFVAFNSNASNLVANDTNGLADVFVYDRVTETTERVSVASNGTQSSGGESAGASISADGRYIAYYSLASNLVAGDTNGAYDAFVFDRETHTTTRVSVADDGTQGNGMSVRSIISPDGQFVAFDSLSSNLVANDTNSVSDVFILDWHLL